MSEHWLFRLGILKRTGPGLVGKVGEIDPNYYPYAGRSWELGPVGSWLLWPLVLVAGAAMTLAAVGIVTLMLSVLPLTAVGGILLALFLIGIYLVPRFTTKPE